MKKESSAFVTQDRSKCIGCRACELACFAVHQKQGGKTVGTVTDTVAPKLFVTKMQKGYAPIQCKHCENAPCLKACTKGAICYEDHQVIIHTDACQDCQDYECVMTCPFDAIRLLPLAAKCDLCAGRKEGPACVGACPNQALRLVDLEAELEAKRSRAAQYLVRMI